MQDESSNSPSKEKPPLPLPCQEAFKRNHNAKVKTEEQKKREHLFNKVEHQLARSHHQRFNK